MRELELEVERLASKAEHLRAQNDVLSLTLYESRAVGERLAVLLGEAAERERDGERELLLILSFFNDFIYRKV